MRLRWTVLLASLTLAACNGREEYEVDGASVVGFDTTRVYVATATDTFSVIAEVARSKEQQTMGLMERRALADSAGMLFVYPEDQPPTAGFWMYRTRIPLDIAFADSAGRIVAVRQMEPCEASLPAGCPAYEPGQPYRAALEVNAGTFARRGITAGARMWSTALPSSTGPTSAGSPLIALRLAFPDSAAGRERVRHDGAVLFLDRDILLSDEDLAGVTADTRGQTLLLSVRCRAVACERLATATGANVGNSLAVLVDSRVRAASRIASSVGARGAVTIAIDASAEDAERIARQVRTRWPAP